MVKEVHSSYYYTMTGSVCMNYWIYIDPLMCIFWTVHNTMSAQEDFATTNVNTLNLTTNLVGKIGFIPPPPLQPPLPPPYVGFFWSVTMWDLDCNYESNTRLHLQSWVGGGWWHLRMLWSLRDSICWPLFRWRLQLHGARTGVAGIRIGPLHEWHLFD